MSPNGDRQRRLDELRPAPAPLDGAAALALVLERDHDRRRLDPQKTYVPLVAP